LNKRLQIIWKKIAICRPLQPLSKNAFVDPGRPSFRTQDRHNRRDKETRASIVVSKPVQVWMGHNNKLTANCGTSLEGKSETCCKCNGKTWVSQATIYVQVARIDVYIDGGKNEDRCYPYQEEKRNCDVQM
jgi:hypothetical protein